MLQLKNRFNGQVIYEKDLPTIKDLTEDAVKNKINLKEANLTGAYLTGADLSGANLKEAYLTRANLTRANLTGAYLTRANLTKADLSGAYLKEADLTRANLKEADLSGAYLKEADLTRANLTGAYLTRANLPNFQIIPEEGEFICYKKVYTITTKTPIILTLKIPENAKRNSNLIGRKNRVSSAIPIKAEDFSGNIIEDTEFKNWNSEYPYIWKMNQENFPENGYCDDIRVECAPGLHVFVTKKEAKEF